MPATYDAHDVWLNGSDVDNMPMSILEAYACGLAVITTEAGGIPCIVESNRTGRLAPLGDVESLARNAVEVIGNPALFLELTRNGLVECEKYAWTMVRPGWMAMYSELAPKNTLLGLRTARL
jgi:glycosyltransferase involved in cell wall biosynthesis